MTDASARPADVLRRERRDALTLLAGAVVVGLVAAAAAAAFSSLSHAAEHLLWDTAPTWWGATEAPWWWVLLVPTLGGVAVWAARLLPGDGGHAPLDGLSMEANPRILPSVLLAALVSLACGAVIGPEAPLLALGAGLGAILARRASTARSQILVLCGATAALGMILGNPMVTALFVLEGAALRPRPTRRDGPARPLGVVLVVLVALGAGYVLRVGVGDWPGVHIANLSAGSLPAYPTLRLRDVVVSLPVAAVVAVLALLCHRLARRVRDLPGRGRARPGPILLGVAGLLIGALAVAVRAATSADVNLVLFSGQAAMGDLAAIGSAGTLIAVLVAKSLAYSLTLGAGFRGGPVFPVVFLGMAAGVLAAVLVPETSIAALAACGIAAGCAAVIGLPVTSALLALLLCISAGPAVTVTAIIGATVGALARAWPTARRQAAQGVVA